jgi:thiol-disulfide isomerase/thioredoxin
MGLDADAKFFYGMPLGASIDELCRRDEERDQLRCPKCKKIVDSKFCPDCGEKPEPTEPEKPGFSELVDEYPRPIPQAKGLEVVNLDGDERNYFLVVKESLKTAGDLRGGSDRRPSVVALGQELSPNLLWRGLIAELCKAIDIRFEEPQFYLGFYMSH